MMPIMTPKIKYKELYAVSKEIPLKQAHEIAQERSKSTNGFFCYLLTKKECVLNGLEDRPYYYFMIYKLREY